PWLLAGSQVVTCGVVSVIGTAFLPSPYGFQTAFAAISLAGSRRDAIPGTRLHGFRVLGTGDRPDAAWSDGVGGAVQHRAGVGGHPQRGVAERVDDAAAGSRRRAHRGGHDCLRGAALHVPRDYRAGY